MLDSEFWRNLALEFRAINDPDYLIEVFWKTQADGSLEWKVQSKEVVWGGQAAREQFQLLATRAGGRVENASCRDLLSAWFDVLNKEIPSDEAQRFDGPPSYAVGCIRRICEASAVFCAILERRALEAENVARLEQQAKADPRNWPPLLQELETLESLKKLNSGPAKEISDSLVRSLIAQREGINPADVSLQQIQREVSSLLPYYGPKIALVPSLRATTAPESENATARAALQASLSDELLKLQSLLTSLDEQDSILIGAVKADPAYMIPPLQWLAIRDVFNDVSAHVDGVTVPTYYAEPNTIRSHIRAVRAKLEYRINVLRLSRERQSGDSQPVQPHTAVTQAQSPKELRDAYFASFNEKIFILDVCWAAKQHYREWTRWIGGRLKLGTKPDKAFRAVLTSGKMPEQYRTERRPKEWK